MDISKKNLRNNLFYEKSPQPFNPSDKVKISLLTTRIESFSHKGEIRQKVIFYRNDVDTQDFIKNQSKYILDRAYTVAHLQNELSKSNNLSPKQIQLFIKNIHSDIAVMKNYSPQDIEISKKATEAAEDYDEFIDFINICKQFKAINNKYSELPLNIREKNEGISSDDLIYTPDQEKIINNFNYLNLKYGNYLKFFDNKFDKEIWKNEVALDAEKNIRLNLLNSTQKENEEMKLDAHKSSEKIDYLKASLFEDNLEIFNIKKKISEKSSSSLKDTVNPKPPSYKWNKITTNSPRLSRNFLNSNQTRTLTISTSSINTNVTTNVNQTISNSTKSISSNSGSSLEQESIESSLNDKENTLPDNTLSDNSNILVETKPNEIREDQSTTQSNLSQSAREITHGLLRRPMTSKMPYPSVPKKLNN
jgi:hypothetical protein